MNSAHDTYVLLKLQQDLGIDEAISDVAGEWLRPRTAFQEFHGEPARPLEKTQARPEALTPQSPSRTAPAMNLSVSAATTQARALADAAGDLASLEAAVRNFDGCALKRTACNTVFARGNPQSGVMIIGDAPDAEDDKNGMPFSGLSGQLLERMLASIGLNTPDDYYMSPAIFWRPPGNRQPTTEEISICKPFAQKHIGLVCPKLIIMLGGTTTKALLDSNEGIIKLRSKWLKYTNPYIKEPIAARALFHPSYLLRQPLAKRDAWADLLAVHSELNP